MMLFTDSWNAEISILGLQLGCLFAKAWAALVGCGATGRAASTSTTWL
jgi:hypothetical protein